MHARVSAEAGEVGGVASCELELLGRGPGEQNGICLLGTALGVPRTDVLMEVWDVGVEERLDSTAGLAHTVAMRAFRIGRYDGAC